MPRELDRSPLTDLHLHVIVQKQVAQLEVAMDDAVAMQVLAAQDDLPQVVAGLGLRQGFPTLVQLQQGLGERRTARAAL